MRKKSVLVVTMALTMGFSSIVPAFASEVNHDFVNKATREIYGLENLKYSQKNDIVDRLDGAKSQEEAEGIVNEAKALNSNKRVQVAYVVKHVDFNSDKEIIPSQKMVGFAGENVTEHAIFDYKKHFIPANYRSISKDTITKVLKSNGDNTIVFYYVENGLKSLKERKIIEIKNFKNKDFMDQSKVDKAIDDINYATSTDEINKIFNEIKKDDTVKYIQTKLKVRYVDAITGKDLASPTTTIEWFGTKVENIKPEKIEGYAPVKKSEEIFLKNKDTNEVVFQYVRPNDNVSLKDFLKQRVDLKVPVAYENIDFTNNYKGLKEFAIKQIYKRALFAEVIATEKDMEQLVYELIDMPIEGGYTRHCRNVKFSKGESLGNGKYRFTISFTYSLNGFNVADKDIEESENIIDEFISKNITENMSDYDKAKKIYDFIIKKASPYVDSNNKSIKYTPMNRITYAPAAVFIEGKGVCDGYAMAFSRVAERCGLETKWVSSIYSPVLRNQYYKNRFQKDIDGYKDRAKITSLNHAWNQVKIDGKWYNLDTYHGDFYDENSYSAGRDYFFLRSDDTFEKDLAPRLWVKALTNRAENDYR